MKLLYAYFDDWDDEHGGIGVCGPLRGVGVNLDSTLKFSFDGFEKIYVSKGDSISPCFFSYRNKDNLSVSAIVGENGTGKTSFSRLMYLWARGECGRAILIAEIDGKYKIWRRGYVRLEFLRGQNSEISKAALAELNKGVGGDEDLKFNETFFKFIYYSPFYNSEHQMQSEEPFFIDISTSTLIDKEGASKFKGDEAKKVWSLLLANHIDACRTKYEAQGGAPEYERPFLPDIKGASVAIDIDRFEAIAKKYKKAFEQYEEKSHGISAGVKRFVVERSEYTSLTKKELFCRDVVELFAASDKIEAFFPKAFLVWQMMSWNDEGAGLTGDPSGADEIMMRFCKEHLMCKISTKDEISTFRNHVSALVGGSMKMSSSKFDALQDFSQCMLLFEGWKNVKRYDSPLEFDFRVNPKRFNSFITLVAAHARLKTIEDFLLIKCNPPMSGGEWAYLAMLARIHAKVKDLETKCEKPIVLFLDEIETTLHPLWQRALVKSMIQFFETFFPLVPVHMVFASHSPILLSDIPKDNVFFLMKARAGYSVEDMQQDLQGLDNTFGANICDLFEAGYFLDEGPIGAFARDKIKSVLNGKDVHLQAERHRDIVRLLGDPVVRHYLESRVGAEIKGQKEHPRKA